MSHNYEDYLNGSGSVRENRTPVPGATRVNVGATVNQIASDLLQFNNNQTSNQSRGSSSNGTVSVNNANNSGLSNMEAAILRSTVPIDINETQEITVHGQRGIWANRSEVVNWRGVVPIERYEINSDAAPEIITKRTQQQLVYQQEVNTFKLYYQLLNFETGETY
jgi:hypothetical protein